MCCRSDRGPPKSVDGPYTILDDSCSLSRDLTHKNSTAIHRPCGCEGRRGEGEDGGRKKKATKETEFPAIAWKELLDPNVQIATLLYNARINTYREAKALDAEIDNAPTAAAVARLAELRIENLAAHKELVSFNATGQFLHRHPLVTRRTTSNQLLQLRRTDPTEFLRRYHAAQSNLRRYTAYARNPARTKQHEADVAQVKKYTDLTAIFKTLLNE